MRFKLFAKILQKYSDFYVYVHILCSPEKPHVYLSKSKRGGLTSAGGQAPKPLTPFTAALQDRDGRVSTENTTDKTNRSK